MRQFELVTGCFARSGGCLKLACRSIQSPIGRGVDLANLRFQRLILPFVRFELRRQCFAFEPGVAVVDGGKHLTGLHRITFDDRQTCYPSRHTA